MPTVISPNDAATRTGCLLLDVRTPAEFAAIHAVGARNVPLDRLEVDAIKTLAAGSELLLLCHGGARARSAAEKLEGSGLRCVVVDGGTKAWEAAGLPVNRTNRRVLPLDRQVQLTVGPLILLGVILGFTVDPRWTILSGFIGAGLTFAGASGYCGLAYVLGRMPWNRAPAGSPAAPTPTSCCGV
jgi:rhodanese-related sulfurtransferase